MTRLLAAALIPLTAAPALAQGLRDTRPTPQYFPGSPFRPPIADFGPRAGLPGMVVPTRPWVVPPGWGWYGGYSPFFPGSFYGSPYVAWGWGLPEPAMDRLTPTTPPPLQGAGTGDLTIIPELPAELTLEFPADARVWLNGEAVDGEGKTRTLRSPPLRPGEGHTFNVRAEWTADGRRFEWERTVTLNSGQRSRVTVARGFPVSD
jgi:uncharacterized protein (TIGR03000 family)